MINRCEEEVKSLWIKKYGDKPEVTIKCMAYNQEEYIESALDSFLLQITNFPFEIIVHDDASTDHTTEKIMQYARKYPSIGKPIIETENQYSKKDGSLNRIINEKIKGRYIALCEGDDYWTDSNKLQKQYDAMEKHQDIDICAHTVKRINANTGKFCGYIQPSKRDCIFSVKEVILGGGEFVGTNSLFFRREIIYNEPLFRKMLEIDYTLQVEGALRGGMLYIASCMSDYRVLAKNSWSSGLNKKYIDEFRKQWILVVKQIDTDTEYKYHESIINYMIRDKIDSAILLKDFELLNDNECKEYYKKMKGKKRIIYYLKVNYPRLFIKIKSIVKKVKYQ